MLIRTKIYLAILIASVVPTIGIGLYGYNVSKEMISKNVLEDISQIAFAEENRISGLVESDFDLVNSISSRTALRDHLANLEPNDTEEVEQKIHQIIEDVKNSVPRITNIHVTDLSGKTIASTEPSNMGLIISQEDYFQESVSGKPFFNLLATDGKYYEFFSIPLYDSENIIGTIQVQIKSDRLLFSETRGFGETGEYLLGKFSNTNQIELLSSSRNGYGTNNVVSKDAARPMLNALNGIESIFPSILDYKGNEVIAVTKFIDSTGWGLVVKIDHSEAYGHLNQIVLYVSVGILLTIFGVLIYAIYVTNSFAKPIELLKESSRRISNGEFNFSIIQKSNDEIGSLAKDLDYMKNRLKEREEELLKQNDLKDQFINVAAHELKTPVQPIINFSKLALKGWADKDESLRIIDKEGHRLQKLTHDILDVSRIQSGTLSYNFKPLMINGIVEHVIKNVNLSSPDIKINFESHDDVKIKGDEDRLIQVFENIIGNAAKFTIKGNIEISSQLNSKEKLVLVSIKDEAGGISNEILPKLFEKFVTKDVRGSNQGTGLGLFISKAIIEAHGGKILAKNNDSGGATFTVVLPINIENN